MTISGSTSLQRPDPRIRVLAVIKGLGAGGAERLLVSLARVADHTRFSYEVAYVLPHKDAFVPALRAAGVTVHCLTKPDKSRLAWVAALRRLLTAGDYDVLHTHSPAVAGVARAVARTVPRSRRPALVSTEHNSWESYLPLTRLLNAALHGWDDARFAVSTEARASMWPPLRRGVEVLPHGVVLEDYREVRTHREAERDRLGLDPDALVVTTVANLRREKGYPELLAAAAELLSQEPSIVFLAAGQGDQEAALRAEHERLGLGERFRFLGQVDDVPALLAASDIFALPSRFEGMPIAIMEALCVGLPIVATRVGGIPEQVRDGVEAVLLPPREPAALAAALRQLVQDPALRRRMSQAALARCEAYDIRTAAARLEEVYTFLVPASRLVGSPAVSPAPGNPGLRPPSP